MTNFAEILVHIIENVEEEEGAIKENSALMKRLRDTVNPFDMTDKQFTKVFRLSKDAVHFLCNMLHPYLQRKRRNGLSIQTQVIAFIHIFIKY